MKRKLAYGLLGSILVLVLFGAWLNRDKVSVGDIDVGTCVKDPGVGGELQQLVAVDCARPHWGEVVGADSFPSTADAKYAGPQVLGEWGARLCAKKLAGYANPTRNAGLTAFELVPTADSWNSGNRAFLCLAYLPNGELVGSVNG